MSEQITSVLFLCEYNDAPSIMAEALLRAAGGKRFRAYSAGYRPVSRLAPRLIDFLASRHLPVEGLRPRSFMELTAPHGPLLDFIITLGEPAADWPAPEWRGSPVLAYWSAEQDLPDLFWMLQRRIRTFTTLPHARLPRHSIENRVHAIGAWQ